MLESQLQMCTDQAKEHTYLGHHNNLHESGSLASVKPNLATRKNKSLTPSQIGSANSLSRHLFEK